MKRISLALTAVSALMALQACTTTSPDVVSRYDAQRMSVVQDGTVLSVRPVTVEGNQSGTGAVAGGVVGGIAGSSVGGSRESAAIGIIGAVAGAVMGNAIERSSTREEAVELLIQLRNGERRAIVQAKAGETLNPGDAVVLVSTGGRVRVTRAPAVGQPSSASLAPMPASGPMAPIAPIAPAPGASAPIYTPR
jgi:outer membrane lipoprotein SlyB